MKGAAGFAKGSISVGSREVIAGVGKEGTVCARAQGYLESGTAQEQNSRGGVAGGTATEVQCVRARSEGFHLTLHLTIVY